MQCLSSILICGAAGRGKLLSLRYKPPPCKTMTDAPGPSHHRRRLTIALLVGSALIGGYIAALYWFFTRIWPQLPPWAMFLAFLLIAVLVIGSPIAALRAVRHL